MWWNGKYVEDIFLAYQSANIRVDSQKNMRALEVQAGLAPFFMKHHFYLEERMIDKL